jgi:hypothetical protein
VGPGICSQQTGNLEGEFSLLILCSARRGSRSRFHTGSPGGWEGQRRNSLSQPRSQASCGLSGGGVGGLGRVGVGCRGVMGSLEQEDSWNSRPVW